MQAFKVVLCGDVCVGKSAIFQVAQTGTMNEDQLVSTISATFAQIKVKVEDQDIPTGSCQVKLQLWDTAGDEKLRSITRNYYNGASAACIVYDVTSADSLQVAKDWI